MNTNRIAVILPSKGFCIPVTNNSDSDIVEIVPRKEAPYGFLTNHIQRIEGESLIIRKESIEPITVKKNTPLCRIKHKKLRK